MRSSVLLIAMLIFALISTACSDSNDDNNSNADGDVDSEASDSENEAETEAPAEISQAYTTVQKRLVPIVNEAGSECTEENWDKDYCKNPALKFPEIKPFTDFQMGEWTVEDGEDFSQLAQKDVSSTSSDNRRSLFRWVHMSDIHITDEESMLRMGNFDTKTIPSALRPMDMYTELVLDAAVNVINYFNNLAKFDLVLLSGDSTDTAQRNEFENLIAVLNGGTVDPDSGADDDPVEGANNDPQDPFEAKGLGDTPWIIAFGNHDELVLGNWEIDSDKKAQSLGDEAGAGTRHGKTFEVVNEDIEADSNREALNHEELIKMMVDTEGTPKGHGFTDTNYSENKGYYTFEPSDNSIVRFIVLDSAFRPEGYAGQDFSYVSAVIDIDQFDNFLVPQLKKAQEDKKLVIISMHHGSKGLQDDNHPDRFVDMSTFRSTIAEYDNVLVHCVGHSHENTVDLHAKADGSGGYFEVQSSALVDWPQQFRFYELVDNGDETVSVFTAVIDHQGVEGSMSEFSRALSLIDVQTGWGEGGPGLSEERNVEMIFKKPAGFEDVIKNAEAIDKVQSLTNWAK